MLDLIPEAEEETKEGIFDNLKYLKVTGEEIKPNVAWKWFTLFPKIPMVNAYGPTEASDDITHFIFDRDYLDTRIGFQERIPLGKTVQNLTLTVRDEHLNLVGPGIEGEIYVAGVGVGRGYINEIE